MRKSIEPTYDSRVDGKQYSVTVWLNDKVLDFERKIDDPFVSTSVTVGWWDAIKSIVMRRCVRVNVHVRGNSRITEDVMELDGNYLGLGRSTRRDGWNQHVQEELHKGAELHGLMDPNDNDA